MRPHPRRAALAGLLLPSVLLAGCGRAPAPEDLPPSVILVSWDTVRRDHLSLYGYERQTSPFLDSFAEECVVYDEAYTTVSFTLIAHMSMLTGLYPQQHEVAEETALAPEIPTLAERLRDRSYYNIAVFRGGWIDERFGYDRGFDVFESRMKADAAGEALRQALAERPRNRPFFLFLHLFDAHSGNLDDPMSSVYDPPRAFADAFREGAGERIRELSAREVFYGQVELDEEQAKDLVALYDASILYLDSKLEEWVGEWREEGILDNALFVLTSDHGEALGERDSKWHGHGGFFEEGLRVPLVVRYPDLTGAGTRSDRLSSVVDITPTVLDVLDLPVEDWVAGRSLLEPREPGETIVAERKRVRVVTDGRHKTIGPLGGRGSRVFDLEADPGERSPLSADEAKRLTRELFERSRPVLTLDPPGEPIPADAPTDAERDELDALGYAEDEE